MSAELTVVVQVSQVPIDNISAFSESVDVKVFSTRVRSADDAV